MRYRLSLGGGSRGQQRARVRWRQFSRKLLGERRRAGGEAVSKAKPGVSAANAAHAARKGTASLASVELPGSVRHPLIKDSADTILRIADCISFEGASALGRLKRREAMAPQQDDGQLPTSPFRVARSAEWSAPGTIDVFQRKGARCQHVNAYAQFQPGAAQESNSYQPGPHTDSARQRGLWLVRCLKKLLGNAVSGASQTLAIDWDLSEGCDAETRSAYVKALRVVAQAYPSVYIVLVQDPSRMIASLKQQLIDQRLAMEQWLDGQGGDPIQKVLGKALVAELETAVLNGGVGVEHSASQASIERAALEAVCDVITKDAGSRAEGVARLLDMGRQCAHACVAEDLSGVDAEVSRMPAAIRRGFERLGMAARGVAESNEQIDQKFREHVRQKLEKGELTADSLAESFHAIGRAGEASLANGSRGAEVLSTGTTFKVKRSAPSVRAAHAALANTDKIVVSSSDPRHYTPSRILDDVFYVTKSGARVPVGKNIWDTGSSVTLIGLESFNELEKQGCMRRAPRLATSISHVNGIGAMNLVHFHASFILEFGGARVECCDVPVLANFSGLLIGNDLQLPCKALTDLAVDRVGDVACDGAVSLQSAPHTPISRPVPVAVTQERPGSFRFSAIADVPSTQGAGFDSACVSPIAYAPEPLRVPAWSEKILWVRVPHEAVAGHDLAMLPLEDARAPDLGLLIAPGLARPDKRGMVPIKVVNPSQEPKRIPVLTPLARFMVDPEISGAGIEYTTDEIMERINLPKDSTEEELQWIRHMINLRRRLFSSKLGVAHGYRARIDTPRIDSGEVKPPSVANRRRSPEEYAALKTEIEKQLKAGLLQRVRSPYNAMPLLVKKPDGTYRCVLDFRMLNQYCVKDTYPLPNIEENLGLLGEANLFTTADLLQGFFQVELEEDSIPKTAFSTPLGQVAYSRMPMGLTSSPSAFMRLVDAALQGLPPGLALAFVDDICCPTSGDMRQHMVDVGRVFDRLIEAGFRVKCSKVHVGKTEVPYLGFLVGRYGTRPDPSKLKALIELTIESIGQDTAAAARFAGMITFYSRFIPHLQTLLDPFHRLKVKGCDTAGVLGSLRFKASFAACKQAITNITAISRPRNDRPFYIHCDTACTGNLSMVLSQREVEDDPTTHKPLAFYSRRLMGEERGYPVRDQECLALFEAFKHWRPYLNGATTIVCTDHRSLSWLLSTTHREGSRVATWAAAVSPFMPEIQYIPGKDNVVADFFTRVRIKPVDENQKQGEGGGDYIANQPGITDQSVTTEPIPSTTTKAEQDPQDRQSPLGVPLQGPGSEAVPSSCPRCEVPPTGEGGEVVGGSAQHPSPLGRGAPPPSSNQSAATLACHSMKLLSAPSLCSADIDSVQLACIGSWAAEYMINQGLLRHVEDQQYEQHTAAIFAAGVLEEGIYRYIDNPSFAKACTSDIDFEQDFASLISHSLSDRQSVVLRTELISIKLHTHWARQQPAASEGAPPLQLAQRKELSTLQLTSLVCNGQLPSDDSQRLETLRRAACAFGTAAVVCVAEDLDAGGDNAASSAVLYFPELKAPTVACCAAAITGHELSKQRRVLGAVGCVLLQKDAADSVCVLLERFDGEYSLPQQRTDKDGKAWYRAQLLQYLQGRLDYSSFELISSALSRAKRHRSQRGKEGLQYYIAGLPAGRELTPTTEGALEFVELSKAVELVARERDADVIAIVDNDWRRSTGRPALGKRRLTPSGTVLAALRSADRRVGLAMAAVTDDANRLPLVADVPHGPAHVFSMRDAQVAVNHLLERVRDDPRAVLAVDLEGLLKAVRPKIDLIQVAVDATDGWPALCYVFNIHRERNILASTDDVSLRTVLQGEAVKVLHCCRGDAAALAGEFQIHLRNPFDTAIADSVLNGKHRNTQRRLDKVLVDRLGADVVNLTHKGKLVHVPGMFQEWPLSEGLYVYAYEDVLYLGALYQQLRQDLESEGVLEFVMECSRQRCDPLGRTSPPPSTVVIGLTDGESVVCLEAGGLSSLPSAAITGREGTAELKMIAKQAWEDQMGAPPKGGVSTAVNGSLQKPMRVGNAIVLTAKVPDCVRSLPLLQTAWDARGVDDGGRIVLRTCCTGIVDSGVPVEQRLCFQYLAAEAMRSASSVGRVAALTTEVESTLQLRAHLEVTEGCVRLSLASVRHAAVVIGATLSNKRAAVIITDGSLVYLLHSDPPGSSGVRWAFPSHKIEIGGTAEEAVVKAIDLWVGAAVHKGGELDAIESAYAICPKLAKKVCAALHKLEYVGEFDNTLYYACKLESLQEHWACFHAARRRDTIAAFRLTDQQERLHNGFEFCMPSEITSGVSSSDVSAALAAEVLGVLRESFQAPVPSRQAPKKKLKQEGPAEPINDGQAVCAAVAGGSGLSRSVDQLVLDADGRLVEAATLLHLAAVLEDGWSPATELGTGHTVGEGTGSTVGEALAAAFQLPRDSEVDATGAPPKFHIPSDDEICLEQREHPALRPIVLSLLNTPTEETGAPALGAPDRATFEAELALHKLDEDSGLLLRWVSAKGKNALEPLDIESQYKVVLPPRFHSYAFMAYHDRVGHLGLSKCFPLLARRYYWGAVDQMRGDLASYINACPVCRRAKIDRHRRGEGTLVTNGEWPFDVVSADHMSVGRQSVLDATDERIVGAPGDAGELEEGAGEEEEGPQYFDGTLTFADQFTRLIVCAPVKGKPTAQMVARLLMREVIRIYGTPRQLRSDRGSAFVAAATKALYEAFGIQMEASSAYHHSTVGLVERWHSCLRSLLLTHRIASGQDQWHLYLPMMELIFNNTMNTALGFSPFFVNHMFHPRLPSDALHQRALKRLPTSIPDWVRQALNRLEVVYDTVGKTLQTNALHSKRVYDLKRDVITEFVPGDRVLLIKGQFVDGKLPKSEEPTDGPFTVVRRTTRNRYVLMGPQSRKVQHPIHIDRLVQFPSRRSIPEDELSSRYPVKRISGRRIVHVQNADGTSSPRVEYRLQWIGFGKRYPYWRPMECLHDVAELVADYNRAAPPLPPELAAPEIEYECRDIDPEAPAPPLDDAVRRPHFRAIQRPVAELAPAELSPGEVPDPFPPGSRVEVFHTKVDQYWGGTGVDAWLPATVQSTRIFRPRNRQQRPERRILLIYDCDPKKALYETRPGPLVRSLEQAQLAQHSEPADEAVLKTRKSPRLASVAAAFAWSEPRWVGCIHDGAVLVSGSEHTLPRQHHRCFHEGCISAAHQHFASIRRLLPAEAMSMAAQTGRLLGAVHR